jgi:hypothetical protein
MTRLTVRRKYHVQIAEQHIDWLEDNDYPVADVVDMITRLVDLSHEEGTLYGRLDQDGNMEWRDKESLGRPFTEEYRYQLQWEAWEVDVSF